VSSFFLVSGVRCLVRKIILKTLLLCPLAIALVLSVAAQAPKAASPQQSAESYIRESEAQWAESVATGDTTAIERILADDFIGTDPKGELYDKAKMIADTKDAPKYFVSNHLDQVKIRFFGNTAVAQGSESWVRRDGGCGRFVWTDTWILRDGRWQIVAAEDLIAPPLPAKSDQK
jgi:ketosteroid isomerase-like protein